MKIKLLTYNIDGLNPIEIGYRAQVIIALIMSEDADIIQLQEVIPETYHLLRSALQAQGYASSGFIPFHYFTMTLVKTATFATFSFERIEFNSEATSQQGRSILKTTVSTLDGYSLVFLNCHLESTGVAFKSPESFTRQAQLRAGLDIILQTHTSNTGIALLSGDLNIRDKEADAVLKQFSSIADLSPKPPSNTWFLPHNDKVQYRFDRIYGHNSLCTQISEFRLIGCDPILDSSSGSSYLTPSDHRGISIAFTADRSNTSSVPPDLQRKRERPSSPVNNNDHEENNIATAKKKTTKSISNDRTNNSYVELIDLT
jgi:exonuclease III